MNELQKKVLALLRDNARYSIEEIAKMTGERAKTIEEIIKALESSGAIVKYSAIVNSEVLEEKNVQALIEVKVAPQKLKGFDSCAEEIYEFPEVQSLYLMSGGFDLAVFVEGKDISDIARFVAEKLSVIDGIVAVQTHFILKKYKIEGQPTKPLSERERQIILA